MTRDSGSILPLGIGILAISLAFSLLLTELGSLRVQEIRNKQVSDLLALEVSGQLLSDGIPPVIGLDYLSSVRKTFTEATDVLGLDPTAAQVLSLDGKTIEARFCTHWTSITGFTFGNAGEVCVESKARAI